MLRELGLLINTVGALIQNLFSGGVFHPELDQPNATGHHDLGELFIPDDRVCQDAVEPEIFQGFHRPVLKRAELAGFYLYFEGGGDRAEIFFRCAGHFGHFPGGRTG